MSIPTYMTVIEQLFTELDVLLNNYVFHAYTTLAAYLKAPLGLAMMLYIIIMGWSITQGWVKLSMNNLVKSSLTLAVIYTAAMNWGWFSHYCVDFITQGSSQIASTLSDVGAVHLPHFAGEGVNGAMQSILIEFTQIGSWVWDSGSWHNWSPCLTALLTWGFGDVLILVGVFELVLAKIMLAVLFATAPLFVGFTLFKHTRPFFDRWLGACVGFGLLMIFVSTLLSLSLHLAQWVIAGTYLDHATRFGLVGFVPVMVVGCICVGVILKVAQLAQGIGGTVTTTSGSSLLAGTVGGAIGGTFTAIKMPVSGMQLARRFFKGNRNDTQSSAKMNAIREKLTKSEEK